MNDPRFLRIEFAGGKVIVLPVAKINSMVSEGNNTVVYADVPGTNGAIQLAKGIDEIMAMISPESPPTKQAGRPKKDATA